MRFVDKNSKHTIPDGELSIAVMDNREIAAIHARFMDDDSATDVITFPGDAAEKFAGEICVSAEQAIISAEELGKSLSSEIALYLVHGWLHLAGFNDHTEQDRKSMRKAEKEILDLIRDAGLHPRISTIENTCPRQCAE